MIRLNIVTVEDFWRYETDGVRVVTTVSGYDDRGYNLTLLDIPDIETQQYIESLLNDDDNVVEYR